MFKSHFFHIIDIYWLINFPEVFLSLFFLEADLKKKKDGWYIYFIFLINLLLIPTHIPQLGYCVQYHSKHKCGGIRLSFLLVYSQKWYNLLCDNSKDFWGTFMYSGWTNLHSHQQLHPCQLLLTVFLISASLTRVR